MRVPFELVHDDPDTDALLERLLVHPSEELVTWIPITVVDDDEAALS